MAEMEPEITKRAFQDGAILIALDVPEGTEFGIDYKSWNVGPLFKGIKMIPPGLHFVSYSSVNNRTGQSAPRTGMFCFLKWQDVLVMKWDPGAEDFVMAEVDEEEKERYRTGISLSFTSSELLSKRLITKTAVKQHCWDKISLWDSLYKTQSCSSFSSMSSTF